MKKMLVVWIVVMLVMVLLCVSCATKSGDTVKSHYALGFVYFRQGKLDEAIKEYKTAISLDPNHLAAHYSLGVVYFAQGKLDEAIAEFKTAINLWG